MKNYITNAAKLLLAIVMIIPIVSMAQKQGDETFTYGDPTFWRPYSQNGIGVFETTKANQFKKFEGKTIRFGAGFTQQYQSIKHSNSLSTIKAANSGRLFKLQPGLMTAQANLFIDAQLADGITLNVTNYMSARHHNEFWVKGGYLQVDKLPFDGGEFLNNLMKYATIKAGHFEVNYGDAHFRRPDGGHTLQSPFMEGNIMDAFATEIGGEIYLQKDGLFGMLGVTNGMIKGHVDSTYVTTADANINRNPSIILKAGIDKQVTDNVRLRLSGSMYTNSSNAGSGLTLYSGDRTGSNYQNVMEVGQDAAGVAKAYTAMMSSGRYNPGFSKKITAVMVNGFAKVYGFEAFLTYETAKGRSKTETADRTANQFAIEGLYRFGAAEKFYLGAKYNTVTNKPTAAYTKDITINRTVIGAGYFITKNVLMKAEYVNQEYKDFLLTDFRAGGKFDGFVIEAAIGF
jgi:hypothetical protein